jgi:hypothetical protein
VAFEPKGYADFWLEGIRGRRNKGDGSAYMHNAKVVRSAATPSGVLLSYFPYFF